MLRARIQQNNKEYALGGFQTKKEVNAAKAAAARVLERVEADKPAPIRRSLPSLSIIMQLVERGVYDNSLVRDEGITILVQQLLKRQRMLTIGVENATQPAQTLSKDDLLEA
jgi:hypothetical protein